MSTKQTKNRSRYAHPLSEAELEERFDAAITRMMEPQPSTSEPSIDPTPSEALAEALTEQRALAEIWASIAEPDWSPKCSHTEIINYHCLVCGVNFC
jgi:hypothetical protein